MDGYEMFSPASRVWIYQSNRAFTEAESSAINQLLAEFAASWISHNRQLRAWAGLFHQRFVVLMVDESQADASGCSIDKSVAFLKQLQAQFEVDLFDRMLFSTYQNETVRVYTRESMQEALDSGEVSADTPVFDNLVNTLALFESSWIKLLSESWYKRFFKIPAINEARS